MAQAKITMQIRAVNTIASIIDIRGELNASAEKLLIDTYTAASTATTHAILLNFSGLEYMNSSGIGLIVTLLIRVNRQKQRLFAYGLSDHYRHIFQLTRLTDAIQIYASESEAIMALRAIPAIGEVRTRPQGRK